MRSSRDIKRSIEKKERHRLKLKSNQPAKYDIGTKLSRAYQKHPNKFMAVMCLGVAGGAFLGIFAPNLKSADACSTINDCDNLKINLMNVFIGASMGTLLGFLNALDLADQKHKSTQTQTRRFHK